MVFIPTFGLDQAVEGLWRRWVYRGRLTDARRSARQDVWVLTCTRRLRISALLLFSTFSVLYAWGFFVDGFLLRFTTLKEIALSIGSAVLWLLITAIFVGCYLERVTISESHITRRYFSGRQTLPLEAIERFEITPIGGWLQAVSRDQTTRIRVSLFLDGLWTLKDLVSRHTQLRLDAIERQLPLRWRPVA